MVWEESTILNVRIQLFPPLSERHSPLTLFTVPPTKMTGVPPVLAGAPTPTPYAFVSPPESPTTVLPKSLLRQSPRSVLTQNSPAFPSTFTAMPRDAVDEPSTAVCEKVFPPSEDT
jgi:hypothetical protein